MLKIMMKQVKIVQSFVTKGTQVTTDIENVKQETASKRSIEIEEHSHNTAESSEGEARFTSEYLRNTTDTGVQFFFRPFSKLNVLLRLQISNQIKNISQK